MDDELTQEDLLLEVSRQLATIKWVLITLLAVVALFLATLIVESARERSETKARDTVSCTVRGTC